MSPKHAFIDLPLLNCVYLHNGIEWLWNMALWDSPKIETRDTSRRLIFMSVLGKINGAFSHCIMLFNGAIHLIKREHFWNIYVFCFLHTRRPSGPVQIFPSAWLQFLRCRLFLCIMMDDFAFLYSLPNKLQLKLVFWEERIWIKH